MAIIYGVDTDEPVRPIDVRDAIIKCFIQAHDEQLAALQKDDLYSPEEFEKIKFLNISTLIRTYFDEVGGDYENPSKQDIENVIKKLMIFAAKYRKQDIINKHAGEIMQLVNKLS